MLTTRMESCTGSDLLAALLLWTSISMQCSYRCVVPRGRPGTCRDTCLLHWQASMLDLPERGGYQSVAKAFA
ncbi:hypothetical protein DL95DRAFT_173472 [Leptodontidium sp. 2 PMI_412]|nr:hypothetical protein DL95DRAFT_173472 [Leptodontidium sp. 2 PMI_412]